VLGLITKNATGVSLGSNFTYSHYFKNPAAIVVGIGINQTPEAQPKNGNIAIASPGRLLIGELGWEGVVTGNGKSGLFLTALLQLAGVLHDTNPDLPNIGVGIRADAGYQFVSESGFVLTPALGVKFNTMLAGYGVGAKKWQDVLKKCFAVDLMFDIGFGV
jgi:hypothetical protein